MLTWHGGTHRADHFGEAKIALAACLHPKDAEFAFSLMEAHQLDRSSERFLLRRGVGLWSGVHSSMIISGCRDRIQAV